MNADNNKGRFPDTESSYGHMLATPSAGEEVVITGMSGKFPECENIEQLRNKLLNKIGVITEDDRRWSFQHDEVPKASGKLLNIDRFDAGFFGIHHRQAITMDPMVRLILETAYEAIIDAGYHPSELEGSKTGVFVGASISETETVWFREDLREKYFAITGSSMSMLSNRVSYFLKLNGPSYTVNTACSSSMFALENAYAGIRKGVMDAAIVVGVHLCLNPFVAQQLFRLGVLTSDAEYAGYVRSESCHALFLQKTKDSRRIYGQIVHCKLMNEGYRQGGIISVTLDAEISLLRDFYRECMIDPKHVTYVEAHSTGTEIGDSMELESIDTVFCEHRKTPLLTGSIKSNIGHTEPGSGTCGVIKVLLAFDGGIIPPNLNFTKPQTEHIAIQKNRVQVVMEPHPTLNDDDLFGLNNFGFGGNMCHALFKKFRKVKSNGGAPKDNLPRLVCVSGRTEEALNTILDALDAYPLDQEYVRLYHQVFSKPFVNHHYRGYTILTKDQTIKRSSHYVRSLKRPLYLAFSSFGNSWVKIYEGLKIFPLFSESIQRVGKILSSQNFNLDSVIENNNLCNKHPNIYQIIGDLTVQIGLADLMKTLNIQAESILSFGVGEIVSKYFENSLTLEETVILMYQLALHSSTEYLVSATAKELKQLPNDVFVKQIHPNGVTLIGNQKNLLKYVKHLKDQGFDVQNIGDSDVNVGKDENFQPSLYEALITPNKRAFLLSNLSERDMQESYVFEIGTGFLQAYNERINSVDFANLENTNCLNLLLQFLGSLYNAGCNIDLARIYPKVEYPVSRSTPMISPFIKWDHSNIWQLKRHDPKHSAHNLEVTTEIDLNSAVDSYYNGCVLNGNIIFPRMGYLYLVWKALTSNLGDQFNSLKVVFLNCCFLQTIPISKDTVKITVLLKTSQGYFEVLQDNVTVANGKVFITDDIEKYQTNLDAPAVENHQGSMKLTTEDIYKELRLKGYTYSDHYHSLIECNTDTSIGKIRWIDNWVVFLESMLQMNMLQDSTHDICTPVSISRLSINTPEYLRNVQAYGKDLGIPCYVHKNAGIIRSAGIEICGVRTKRVLRKSPIKSPVLHKYQFVPFETCLGVRDAVLVNIQLALENTPTVNAKIVELIDEETSVVSEPLSPILLDALNDLPRIQGNVVIFANKHLNVSNVKVENKTLDYASDCYLIIGTAILERSEILEQAMTALHKEGYLLSREPLHFDASQFHHPEINILTVYSNSNEKLVLCRKFNTNRNMSESVRVDDIESFGWLEKLQELLKNNKHAIIYSENQSANGIMGLANCLMKESEANAINAVLISDENAPKFDLNNKFYKDQLKKSLLINVYKSGKWGSYRFLNIDNLNETAFDHCVLETSTKKDLPSIRWVQGPLTFTSKLEDDQSLVHVYYTTLNHNGTTRNRERDAFNDTNILSFAGRDSTGQRVMGIIAQESISNLIIADKSMVFPVPDHWTMEDAVTVPLNYGIVIFSLFLRSTIKPGNSILIHSGASGVGQAAINVCLNYDCKVFTTVETEEERHLLKTLFSKVTDNVIGNSNDLSFEQLIHRETKGRGVDFVLGCLSGEKLSASVRCLATNGQFLQLNTTDSQNNYSLRLLLTEKEATLCGIKFDQIFSSNIDIKMQFSRLFVKNLTAGSIQPLVAKCFAITEIENAFKNNRFNGKEVAIKIREEEKEKLMKPELVKTTGMPRYLCDSEKVIIVIGGLGGFGLELANWLILRGAKNLVLSSRNGVRNGYQAKMIKYWRSEGVTILLSTADITTKLGCNQLIEEATKLGPIQSIFNSAVVLSDAMLTNQTRGSFYTSFAPKAYATSYLDEITRTKCPQLRDFVVFSTLSCGHGTVGQTNYGMSNSVMERICEKRKADGYPALAIEWGPIADVGVYAEQPENEALLRLTGLAQQPIKNFLENLDVLLLQNCPIVSVSYLAAKQGVDETSRSIVQSVAKILGLKDFKSISLYSTLSSLGVDSMSSVEIKQTMEREFQVTLSSNEIYDMTFAKLYEMEPNQPEIVNA